MKIERIVVICLIFRYGRNLRIGCHLAFLSGFNNAAETLRLTIETLWLTIEAPYKCDKRSRDIELATMPITVMCFLHASVKITCNLCGVSCTGEGEAIIRGALARDIAAMMEYKGLKLQEAVDWVVKNRLDGQAGMIVVSSEGEVAYRFNSNAILWGCATEDGFMEVGIQE
ncbi:hypothetical protein Sjap_006017 [Stephania japonica]|uniref:Uncharacterized protein n=1 Tax=Stephania japonica TaxID=461633 RepID=A0AAP0K6N5_9MAGN